MKNCSSSNSGSEPESVATHPCYSRQAQHYFARLHLAVAPACNIQCNYCNRKYDCSNESRPGVVSERLRPGEALGKAYHFAKKLKKLSVVGIAGPGDSLASPARTFKTLRLIRENFPDVTPCLSTNGLAILENLDAIIDAGVKHVTVTVNTTSPKTAMEIYDWVLMDGKKSRSIEAMEWFLNRQTEGVRALVGAGVLVKVNSVLIPGLNDAELPALAKKLKLAGVFMHNIMPLISDKAHGTKFGLEGRPEPTPQMVESVREACGDIKQMAHCRQCRADAAGMLDDDRFAEHTTANGEGFTAERDHGQKLRAEWRERVAAIVSKTAVATDVANLKNGILVACCSAGNGLINQHFGHAREFYVYKVINGRAEFINVRRVKKPHCSGSETCGEEDSGLEMIIKTISDCSAVVSLKTGYGINKKLLSRGVLSVTDLPYVPIEKAAVEAAERAGRAVVGAEQFALRGAL
ncbi:MAG: nitrogenase cofactor biosynthesis protein NifB [Nitrospinae bacterium]|nr:nitrogenase cofactor biosynthesis protein NifB [Nitrospinota bacterium]